MPGSATDHLANERTFLAWVRTAVTIMALGFVVARFGLLLRELGAVGSAPPSGLSEAVGVLLVLAGGALMGLALVRFVRVRVDLEAGRYTPRAGIEYGLTALVIAVAIGLGVYLLLTG